MDQKNRYKFLYRTQTVETFRDLSCADEGHLSGDEGLIKCPISKQIKKTFTKQTKNRMTILLNEERGEDDRAERKRTRPMGEQERVNDIGLT